jgi:SAM-dependent methyltransferase
VYKRQIDHLDRAGLVEKYRGHGVDLDAIEDVDFVWRGESYVQLTGRAKSYDWVIASHVLEHAPDFIAFLLECDSVLKNGGILSLALPDKRYCFDRYRPLSGFGAVIDAHEQRRKLHSPGTVAEHCLYAVSLNGAVSWCKKSQGHYAPHHNLETAREKLAKARAGSAYLDVHAWCFTPSSFRLLIEDLYAFGMIPFCERGFFPTSGCEFFIALSRTGSGPGIERMRLAEMIDLELKE